MRKGLLFLMSFFTVCYHSFAQDSTYYNVLWKPTTVYKNAGVRQEIVYEYVLDSIANDSLLLQINEYNNDGQLTKRVDFNRGVVSKELLSSYSGALPDSAIELTTIPKKEMHYRYHYDAANKLQKETINSGKTIEWTRYVYNSHYQPLEVYKTDRKGKEQLYTKYIYRPDNLIFRIDYYVNGSKRPVFAYVYEYELQASQPIVKRLRWIASPGEAFLDTERTYNSKWQLVKTTTPNRMFAGGSGESFTMNSWAEEEIFNYLPNGLLNEKKIFRNGKLNKIERHFYL